MEIKVSLWKHQAPGNSFSSLHIKLTFRDYFLHFQLPERSSDNATGKVQVYHHHYFHGIPAASALIDLCSWKGNDGFDLKKPKQTNKRTKNQPNINKTNKTKNQTQTKQRQKRRFRHSRLFPLWLWSWQGPGWEQGNTEKAPLTLRMAQPFTKCHWNFAWNKKQLWRIISFLPK